MKSNKEILIIDPSISIPEIEAFNRMSKASSIPLTFHLPHFNGCGSLERTSPEGIAGVVVLGSLASVHDQRPWQKDLVEWLNLVPISRNVPILGICFGHQLLHLMAEGIVSYVHESKELEIGRRVIELKGDSRLAIHPPKGEVFIYHSEHVSTLGKGYQVWSSGSLVPFECTYHSSKPIWTIQAHPEVTIADCAEFYVDPKSFSNEFGWSIVDTFLDYCKDLVTK
jgi:GMP synthase (glutamine-hydrolysing)